MVQIDPVPFVRNVLRWSQLKKIGQ